jgi:hypothetical protein
VTAVTPTASPVDADTRPIAELSHNPDKSTAAPWEAVYLMHGVMVSSRYWTKEAANTALSDAGFRVVEKD